MERFLINQLIDWKNSPDRKPLVLNGARQVGKTWLLKEFGQTHFKQTAYVSLDNNTIAQGIFNQNFDTARIINELSLLTGINIQPNDTLVILDEIQSCPNALTSLKYFCENAPEFAIATAGSLLGLSVHVGSGYPVGKVSSLNLYPLNFREFLDATGNQQIRMLLDSDNTQSINNFLPKAYTLLKQYYVVGGMPAAVSAFISDNDFNRVRKIQEDILLDYTRDFSKHAPRRLYPRMIEAWESIPNHLSQENKKFVFGHIRTGARSKDYEEVLTWLSEAGLIIKCSRVTKPGQPLSAYNDNKSFKVFLVDIGLLGAMAALNPATIISEDKVFTEFKGALTEQYVCQELVSECNCQPYYWSAENSIGEIDFLAQNEANIYAIEVKAKENLRSKSLKSFKENNPSVCAIRVSLSGYRKQDWLINIPLCTIANVQLWHNECS